MTSSKKIITLIVCLTLAVHGTFAGMLMHHGSNGELASLLAAGVLTLLFLNSPSEGPAFGIGHHGHSLSLGKLFSHGLPLRGHGLSHALGLSGTFGPSKPGLFHRLQGFHGLHGSHQGLFQGHKNHGHAHIFGGSEYNRILKAIQMKRRAAMLLRLKGNLKHGMFGGHNALGHGLHFGSSNNILTGHKHIRPNLGIFKQGFLPLHQRHSSLLGAPKAPFLLKSLLR